MIHAAVFRSADPAERATLIVTGSREQVALNTPHGGCWRELPPGCSAAGDRPALGELAEPVPGDQPAPPE